MVWSAFNGVGLALVIPCVASLIADYHPPETRGQAFGLMAFTSGLGNHNITSVNERQDVKCKIFPLQASRLASSTENPLALTGPRSHPKDRGILDAIQRQMYA